MFTAPAGAVVEYTRASQDSRSFQDSHSEINLVELAEKNDGSGDLVRISGEGDGIADGIADGVRFVEKRDGSADSIQLDNTINLVQLPKKRQDTPLDLIQLSKHAIPTNLFQLSEKHEDSPINLIEFISLTNHQTHKHKSTHPRNVQDTSINLVKLSNRQDSPTNLIELSNSAKAKYLQTRQNDCGSSPYQNPSCSAAGGLSVRGFMVVAFVMVAVLMV